MSILDSDPTYIPNKDQYFMDIAKQIEKGSNHPVIPGGCVIVRQRELMSDGRNILASCKIEIDCLAYAIAAAAKSGTPLIGSTVYTTRYPFPASVFQAHLIGIRRLIILWREWEPAYTREYRRAADLARTLGIDIDVYHDCEDENTKENSREESDFQARTTGRTDIDIKEFTTDDYQSDSNI